MLRNTIVCLIILLVSLQCHASDDVISVFPLDNYDQHITTWLNPASVDYDKSLLPKATQKLLMQSYYEHTFGDLSPWSKNFVEAALATAPIDLKSIQDKINTAFSNHNKNTSQSNYSYLENFRPVPQNWLDDITNSMNLKQFATVMHYNSANRAITIDNLNARILPTEETIFYSHKIAGEGYPFDNLAISMIYAGTPVYILGTTQDKAWSLILTSSYIGWVRSQGLAMSNEKFVHRWQQAAKKYLTAITHNRIAILDNRGIFRFIGFVGAVFPGKSQSNILMIPIADAYRHAQISYSKALAKNDVTLMPLSLTPHHFANILKTMIGQPYGWGDIYHYHDCSSELKAIYTPFGIWLPRNSKHQFTQGLIDDQSTLSPEQRIDYLKKNGKPLVTLVYIGSHIMVYLGNYPSPTNPKETIVMTYQNIWGLKPKINLDKRIIIGQAVFLPLLLSYPEDLSLASLAEKKYFILTYLDQLPQQQPLLTLENIIN